MQTIVGLVAGAATLSAVVALPRRRGGAPFVGAVIGIGAVIVAMQSARGAEPALVLAQPTSPVATPVTTATTGTTEAVVAAAPMPGGAAAPALSKHDQALALIKYPWQQRLQVTIHFTGPRRGMHSESTVFGNGASEITVFERPTDTAQLLAIDIAHELGHLIDMTYLTAADRRAWLTERGRAGATWFACNYCEDYDYGNGDFAETFAADQAGFIDYRSRLAPAPTPAQLRSLERFFR